MIDERSTVTRDEMVDERSTMTRGQGGNRQTAEGTRELETRQIVDLGTGPGSQRTADGLHSSNG